VLRDHYDEIVTANTQPDPQPVPASILDRVDAVDPEAFLASGVWRSIARSRRLHLPASRVKAALRGELAPLLTPAGRQALQERMTS
jgi:hypothetical protein